MFDPDREGLDIPSLHDYGVITDTEGVERDYRGLHWSHMAFPFGIGFSNTSSQDIVGDYHLTEQFLDQNDNGWMVEYEFSVVLRSTRVAGDLNQDSAVDVQDLEILNRNVALGSTHSRLDVNDDDVVNISDLHHWVTDINSTWIGDANLDGEFNSSDLVSVFQVAKYETNEFAHWSEGDWNADELFNSRDFVTAFQSGGYEKGPRPVDPAAVPEPSSLVLVILGGLTFFGRRSVRQFALYFVGR